MMIKCLTKDKIKSQINSWLDLDLIIKEPFPLLIKIKSQINSWLDLDLIINIKELFSPLIKIKDQNPI